MNDIKASDMVDCGLLSAAISNNGKEVGFTLQKHKCMVRDIEFVDGTIHDGRGGILLDITVKAPVTSDGNVAFGLAKTVMKSENREVAPVNRKVGGKIMESIQSAVSGVISSWSLAGRSDSRLDCNQLDHTIGKTCQSCDPGGDVERAIMAAIDVFEKVNGRVSEPLFVLATMSAIQKRKNEKDTNQ